MSLTELWRRLTTNARGNVSVVFGIAVIPLMLAAGIAVDFIRQSGAQAKLQAAVDTAALARGTSRENAKAKVLALVNGYLDKNGIDGGDIALKSVKAETLGGDMFRVTATAEITSSTLRLAGYQALEVNAVSEVARSYGDLELALVLDNTASMHTNGKINALKDAASELVETVFDSARAGHAKVSVVPFSNYVNIGEGFRGAPWLDILGERTETRESCTHPDARKSNCRQRSGTCYNDGSPYTCRWEECDWDYGRPVCAPQSIIYRWAGCVGSPPNPEDAEDRATSRIPAIVETGRSCPNPLLELTDRRADVLADLDGMTVSGETYIPAGLGWGWRTLSSHAPLEGALSYDEMREKPATKAIVLMTDGINSLYPVYPTHGWIDQANAALREAQLAQSNGLVKLTCDNAAAEGIRIYTIAFEVPDDGVTKPMLEYCAKNGGLYFDAGNRSELMAAFSEIGQSLAMLRIAR